MARGACGVVRNSPAGHVRLQQSRPDHHTEAGQNSIFQDNPICGDI